MRWLSKTNHSASLRHVDGFPVLRLLRRLRHLTASSVEPAAVLPQRLCDHLTRSGFPGSFVDTQAFPVRLQRWQHPTARCCSPRTSQIIGRSCESLGWCRTGV